MYVRVPDSLGGSGSGIGGGAVRRGVRETAIVESVDLMPTLADLAGLHLPPQVLLMLFVFVFFATRGR